MNTKQVSSTKSERETSSEDKRSTGVDYSKPPFTADEFIEKIVRLMQIHSGYVTPPDFEKVFNVKFNHMNKNEEGSGTGFNAGKDWYF
jgi:hypothetical protein